MVPSIFARIAPTRWGVAVSLLILAATGALKWNASLMPEHVAIPNPPPISPNARDTYDQAETLMRDDDLEKRIFDAQSGTGQSKSPASALLLQRQLVAANLPALALLRQGLRQPYQAPPVRSAATLLPYYAKDRAMARALNYQAQTRAADGDWSGAISSELDAIQLGASIEHKSMLVGGLVGAACMQIGRKTAWGYVDHLDARQAEAAARRLAGIDASIDSSATILQQEEWTEQAILLEAYRMRGTSRFAEINDDSGSSVSFGERLALQLESPRTAYQNYTRYTSEQIRRDQLPWPEQKMLKTLPLPSDPMSQIMLPEYMGVQIVQRDNIALNALLETELALRAYSLQHGGAYPGKLAQLVSAYLPSVPTDPFSDGQPLRYWPPRAGEKPRLYSVGPDAKDDGGVSNSVDDTHLQPGARLPQANSIGDLLAGKN